MFEGAANLVEEATGWKANCWSRHGGSRVSHVPFGKVVAGTSGWSVPISSQLMSSFVGSGLMSGPLPPAWRKYHENTEAESHRRRIWCKENAMNQHRQHHIEGPKELPLQIRVQVLHLLRCFTHTPRSSGACNWGPDCAMKMRMKRRWTWDENENEMKVT